MYKRQNLYKDPDCTTPHSTELSVNRQCTADRLEMFGSSRDCFFTPGCFCANTVVAGFLQTP